MTNVIVGGQKDVDVLVNAAGTTHYSLLTNTKAEQLEQVVQTNLMGTIWSCKYMVKNMMRRKTGCIMNVASLLGLKGGTGSTVYAASKAGIIGKCNFQELSNDQRKYILVHFADSGRPYSFPRCRGWPTGHSCQYSTSWIY